jgi:hypothetical protein
VIAAGVTATSGKTSFTPAVGPPGRRAILATVTQNGLTDQTSQVAAYTAPATSSLQVTVLDKSKARGKITIRPARITCTAAKSCTLPVLTGRTVTLTPHPARGSRFSWTSGLCTGTGSCTLTVRQLVAVTGTFSRKPKS